MPNLITHTIFARKVFENLEDSKYKTWISENKKEYTIGTNGPDFLFFHDLFPLWKKQDRKIANIGSKIHAKNINLFFETAIDVYTKETDETIKKAMAAYICGHYLHWQLDSIMHPYVVYRTGFKEKNSSSYHHRFESMMDTMPEYIDKVKYAEGKRIEGKVKDTKDFKIGKAVLKPIRMMKHIIMSTK